MADTTTTPVKHLLTPAEAAEALRTASADDIACLELYLSAVDDSIKNETGHDWVKDDPIDPTAKLAASILLISLYDGTDIPAVYNQKIIQLHAKVLEMDST